MANTDQAEFDPLEAPLSVRLTVSERAELDRVAVLEDRPLSWLIRKAVRDLLDGYPQPKEGNRARR